jgi:glycosyltransferase involved in cell wall biosynthesis
VGIIFINASGDTFTPTRSGAIGTWIWEVCRAAARDLIEPMVISKAQSARPYAWKQLRLLEFPRVPNGRLPTLAMRAERKLTGWAMFRQGAFARRVAGAIRDVSGGSQVLFLQNDPELAVFVKERFPESRVVHHFQNQQECREPFRTRFRSGVDVVTAVSDFTARWIEKYYRLPDKSVETLYSGVDINRFSPQPWACGERPIISFIGRTGIEKAPDLVLSAAARIAKFKDRFEVQILGSNRSGGVDLDAYQLQLQRLSNDLCRLGIQVSRPGHIERARLPDELRRAHIHVVPSRWDEPFGLVTLEGMASGLATIGSRTGGTPEVIGDAGMLFERDSETDLAACLESLVMDEELRRDYGRRARERAMRFTWDRTWKQIRDLAQV